MWTQAIKVVIPAIVLGVSACSGDGETVSTSDNEQEEEEEEEQDGEPTGATCPEEDPPTYETFGEDFMDRYCTGCHAASLTGAARRNAPDDHNFDTLASVREFAKHIDGVAAAGPDATNTEMPPSAPKPSEAERKELGQWLACLAAGAEDD